MTNVAIDPWTFSTSSLPTDPRLMATAANGYLGTTIFGNILHVNGLYNGTVGECHRADVPSPLNVRLCSTKEDVEETFSLSIKTGTFCHILQCFTYTATQQIFAHRSHKNLLANIITLKRTHGSSPIILNLQAEMKTESPDLDLQMGPDFHDAKYIYGSTLVPEVATCPQKAIHMLWNPVPQSLVLEMEQEKSWVFLTVVSETEEDVKEKFVEGLELINKGQLYPSHENAWAELWAGSCVDVEGSLNLKQAVYGCLYYLLSSLPPLHSAEEFYGISPGGLSNGSNNEDYWGHVFWDQDTWMYPNILLFYPEMAAHILKYRIRTLRGAEENAQQQGYKGAKFPWESALTGHEVCPEKIYGDQEIHINGDVLLAFKQYYNTTKDLDFFSSAGGWEVVAAIAEYWCSRVVWNAEEQCYHLKGVMPPDEYHQLVDNSIYTNALVQISLKFAIDLADVLCQSIPETWKEVAKKIKLPYDSKMNYHPEYDGYTVGEQIKQADAVLLGYPMIFPMTPEQRKNDLEIYEPVTDLDGPAMTWSMFAVGWLELKQAQVAQDRLKKCFANITEPFKIWTENADGSGAVNFLTGMGGFLQAVLFGYTGFRITDKCLNFDPILPDDVTKLCITGVCYLGNKIKFDFTREVMTVELLSVLAPHNPPLDIIFRQHETPIPLRIGKPVSFPAKAGSIQQRSSCWPL